MRRPAAWAAAALLLAGAALARAQREQPTTFPHEAHAGLFPLCTGCHEGIPEGDSATAYPDPPFCLECHDGEREARVEWTGPVREVTNLDFSHPEHAREVAAEGDRPLRCEGCHAPGGQERMKEVEVAEAGTCLACHAHRAADHYADAACTTCHVPLAGTRFALARIEALPLPDDHRADDFLAAAHGEQAKARPERCATCHTRELCAGCHVNAPRVASIGRIAAGAGRLLLPVFEARYPVPASHERPGFLEDHGEGATAASCATCHARESCLTCHLPPGPRLVAELPAAAEGVAPGVAAGEARYPLPASHRDPAFLEGHGEGATAASCSTCHTQESCTTCHTRPVPRVIAELPRRSPNAAPGVVTARRAPPSHVSAFFASEHGALAGARPERCAACHGGTSGGGSFCQSCHQPLAQGEGKLFRGSEPPRPSLVLAAAPRPGVDTVPPRVLPGPGVRVQVPGRAAARPAAGAQRRRTERPGDFHPLNFIATHSATAYARRLECASCHDTRTFCRDCHEKMGFNTVGRLQEAFHDAQPLWLLRHGQAARQALESCSTCHAQRDCLQCHSATGSFQVNPHGPGFDARRAAERNAGVCRACHIGDPLQRRTP